MTRSSLRAALGIVALLSMLAAPVSGQEQPASDQRSLLAELGGARVQRHSETGKISFISGSEARPAASSATLRQPHSARDAARRFMDRYGSLFGVSDGSRALRVMRSQPAIGGNSFVRFQQVESGVPVLGGELTVQVDGRGNAISANGEASPDLSLEVAPRVTAAAAATHALRAIAKARGVAATGLSASAPELWIYDPALLGGPALEFVRLVWRLDVTNQAGDMRELVLIDASRGNVALHFDQIAEAKNRITCDANSTATKYPCTAGEAARTESSGPSAVADVNNAHIYSGHTYDFFFLRFGRDSLDGAGMALKSTVRYCPDSFNCPYANAFWDGDQMVYGTGYASADDVVGHELAHGVTDHTSSLFYYYQSGAINEAISDIFGEIVDLTNGADGAGGTGAATRWLLGEDLPIGAIRDMEHPPNFDQPDRMQSPIYFGGTGDNGGVHYNSGVANKAAFLMTDGGTFNGQTVTALGIDKTAAMWYRVEAQYLGSASDYADLGAALNQACSDLIGTTPKNAGGGTSSSGAFTAANCTEASQAVLATEMSLQSTLAPAPEAPVCTSGTPTNTFFDNLENTASGNWTTEVIGGSPNVWYYPQNTHPFTGFDATYATSGDTNIWGYGLEETSDSTIRMTSGKTIPANAFLHFRHAYGFENSFDGGVLEYQIGSGAWTDADALPSINGYNGTVGALGGRDGFTGPSNGYISSRYNLASLAGQNVKFRFRIGTDFTVWDYGWFIDDVRIYTCGATPPPGGTTYRALTPARILDTRSTTKLGPAETRTINVAGLGGVPATGVSAVAVNVTVTQPTAGGYLTLFPSDAARPTASNLNFVTGQTIPNLVVVKLGADGKVKLFNSHGQSHVIFDVVGWYGAPPGGTTYRALTPARILDTRSTTKLGPAETRTINVAGLGGVPATGVSAVAVNVTVTQPTAGGYLTLFPSDAARPTASNLNFVTGQTIPNLVVVKLGADGKVKLFNSHGQSHVIFDVVGWYGN